MASGIPEGCFLHFVKWYQGHPRISLRNHAIMQQFKLNVSVLPENVKYHEYYKPADNRQVKKKICINRLMHRKAQFRKLYTYEKFNWYQINLKICIIHLIVLYRGVSTMAAWFKKIFFIVLAVTILSVSVNMFLGPHYIAAGGLTGLAIILEAVFGLDRSVVVFIVNMLIIALTYVFLGKEVFLNTAIGATLLPIIMGFIPHIMLIEDVMLSMIIGSVIFGIAVTILYNNQASSGGTSIPPLILEKYFNMNPSIGLFITDSIVVLLSLFVFELEAFFYAIFSIFITSVTMNYLKTGLNKKKTVYILSEKNDAILNDLLYEVKRGVTRIPVIGGYSQKEAEMLMVTLNSKDYQQLITTVDKFDQKAFIITTTVSDVHGLGFTYDSGSI